MPKSHPLHKFFLIYLILFTHPILLHSYIRRDPYLVGAPFNSEPSKASCIVQSKIMHHSPKLISIFCVQNTNPIRSQYARVCEGCDSSLLYSNFILEKFGVLSCRYFCWRPTISTYLAIWKQIHMQIPTANLTIGNWSFLFGIMFMLLPKFTFIAKGKILKKDQQKNKISEIDKHLVWTTNNYEQRLVAWRTLHGLRVYFHKNTNELHDNHRTSIMLEF